MQRIFEEPGKGAVGRSGRVDYIINRAAGISAMRSRGPRPTSQRPSRDGLANPTHAMHRPSHWLLVLFVVAGVAGWLGGRFEPRPEPAPARTGEGTEPQRVVVHPRRPSRPRPADTRRLTGLVLDPLGWPVTGATIRVTDGAVAVTGPDGRFAVDVLGAGPHDLVVAAAGFETSEVSETAVEPAVVVLCPDLPWTLPPSFGPSPGILAGEGTVVDERGRPVADAVVSAVGTGRRAVTDETGRYRLPLDPDRGATVVARHAGRGIARMEVPAPSRRQGLIPIAQLKLRPGARLRGYVQDATGDPAGGAALQLSGPGVRTTVLADASGGYSFAHLWPGDDYVLEALPWRGNVGARKRIRAGRDLDVELRLRPERPLLLQVRDPDARPRPGVHVLAVAGGRPRAYGVADDLGRVTLRGIAGDDFEFEAYERESLARLEVVRYDRAQRILVVRSG